MKTVFDQSTHQTGEKINNSFPKQRWKKHVESFPGGKTENLTKNLRLTDIKILIVTQTAKK